VFFVTPSMHIRPAAARGDSVVVQMLQQCEICYGSSRDMLRFIDTGGYFEASLKGALPSPAQRQIGVPDVKPSSGRYTGLERLKPAATVVTMSIARRLLSVHGCAARGRDAALSILRCQAGHRKGWRLRAPGRSGLAHVPGKLGQHHRYETCSGDCLEFRTHYWYPGRYPDLGSSPYTSWLVAQEHDSSKQCRDRPQMRCTFVRG
jgi:hypothetical protein